MYVFFIENELRCITLCVLGSKNNRKNEKGIFLA
jgi:hypothetical protein